ncbi:MAG: hypothetical protein C4567_03940 [Deltaproteobacteria bacterium]|nr:MAG: hypothetical protein C4567_03940 [Deltaproteobacteria bacterium]
MRIKLILTGNGHNSMTGNNLDRRRKPVDYNLLTGVEDRLADKGLLTSGNAFNLRWMQIHWTWPPR